MFVYGEKTRTVERASERRDGRRGWIDSLEKIIGKKMKAALLMAAIALVASPIMAATFTVYFKTSNTFTIDPSLTVLQAGIAYDVGTNFESVPSSAWMPCALATSPAWTCPAPVSTVYPGDEIAYGLIISSPSSITPSVNITGAGFTTASYYATMGPSGTYTSGVVSGLPTMAAGVQYSVWLVLTFSPTTTTSAETVSVSFGA